MELSEKIRQAREAKGFSQEALAEQLGLSRQAVSKWELGASVPSPENLEALAEILETDLDEAPPVDETIPVNVEPSPARRRRRILGTAVSVVLLIGLLGIMLFTGKSQDPVITSISFFDASGTPLQTNAGPDFHALPRGRRVLMAVTFQNGTRYQVDAVTLLYNPSPRNLKQLVQWGYQTVDDSRNVVLFGFRVPSDLTGILEVQLNCGGFTKVSEKLNVTSVVS